MSWCFSDMTSPLMTSEYFTWHLDLWHQCISHDINENQFIYRWMTKTKNSFHNKSVTFLQLNDDNTPIGRWIGFHLISCEIHWCHKSRCHVKYSDVINGDVMSEKHEYMTSTSMTSVYFHITSTFMISVFFRHDIYIDDISIFKTWHQHLWYVYFRHDIYIDDFSVFKTVMRKIHWCHQCICHV
jgi:hypothetical protein